MLIKDWYRDSLESDTNIQLAFQMLKNASSLRDFNTSEKFKPFPFLIILSLSSFSDSLNESNSINKRSGNSQTHFINLKHAVTTFLQSLVHKHLNRRSVCVCVCFLPNIHFPLLS